MPARLVAARMRESDAGLNQAAVDADDQERGDHAGVPREISVLAVTRPRPRQHRPRASCPAWRPRAAAGTRSRTSAAPARRPAPAPASAGTLAARAQRQSMALDRWKPHTPARFCARTPRRLVPLASPAGRPTKRSTGRVRNDPPPATTFSAPETRPTANRAASGRSSASVTADQYSEGLDAQLRRFPRARWPSRPARSPQLGRAAAAAAAPPPATEIYLAPMKFGPTGPLVGPARERLGQPQGLRQPAVLRIRRPDAALHLEPRRQADRHLFPGAADAADAAVHPHAGVGVLARP